MNEPNFWQKKDDISMGRKLRLAVIHNLFDHGYISKTEATELLQTKIADKVYDDSKWLFWFPEREQK